MGYASLSIYTNKASVITEDSANLGGLINSNGGSAITERGIVYSITSTNSTPTIGGTGCTKDINGSGTGVYSETISGLDDLTIYSFRAYAINSEGTTYGGVLTFTTLESTVALPSVTTTGETSVTGSSAVLGGNVTSDGGATVTERGVVYARTDTDSSPTIGEFGVTKNTNGSGTGSFSESITGLSSGTGYSFRAYAINSEGTTYGSIDTFTTTGVSTTSVNMSTTGNASSGGACALGTPTTRYHDGAGSEPTGGDTIYTDSGGTNVFNGGGLHYKFDNGYSAVVSSSGVVSSYALCV